MLSVNTYDDGYQVLNTNSSFIQNIHFCFTMDEDGETVIDSEWGELIVKIDGRQYCYQDFALITFFSFINSESLGKFYNSNIRNLYECEIY